MNARHVDADIAGHYAEIRSATRKVSGVGARDQGLGRFATRVDASAPDQAAFRDGHSHSRSGEPARQGRAGLTGPDDDGVKSTGHSESARNAAAPMMRAPSLLSG
jgi:hypothetical protein